MSKSLKVSQAFMSFAQNAEEQHRIWMETVQKLDGLSSLDRKTSILAYISVMAVMRLESGLPFHVKQAKLSGATRDEIISSILVGLPAAGNVVIQALPVALHAFDEDD